jgi:hypothetical protein
LISNGFEFPELTGRAGEVGRILWILRGAKGPGYPFKDGISGEFSRFLLEETQKWSKASVEIRAVLRDFIVTFV